MTEPQKLTSFPCLAHDPDSWELMVCVSPKGHLDAHSFVLGTELMVGMGEDGAEFTVEECPVLA